MILKNIFRFSAVKNLPRIARIFMDDNVASAPLSHRMAVPFTIKVNNHLNTPFVIDCVESVISAGI